MTRLVAAAIAVAFVFAGWRNLPRIDDPQAGVAGLLLGGAVVLAFFIGRRTVHAEAVATAIATAHAEAAAAAHAGAQALSQVVVNVGEPVAGGARQVAAQRYGQPAWIGPARFETEQLEGSDALASMLDDVRDYAHEQDG